MMTNLNYSNYVDAVDGNTHFKSGTAGVMENKNKQNHRKLKVSSELLNRSKRVESQIL